MNLIISTILFLSILGLAVMLKTIRKNKLEEKKELKAAAEAEAVTGFLVPEEALAPLDAVKIELALEPKVSKKTATVKAKTKKKATKKVNKDVAISNLLPEVPNDPTVEIVTKTRKPRIKKSTVR